MFKSCTVQLVMRFVWCLHKLKSQNLLWNRSRAVNSAEMKRNEMKKQQQQQKTTTTTSPKIDFGKQVSLISK